MSQYDDDAARVMELEGAVKSAVDQLVMALEELPKYNVIVPGGLASVIIARRLLDEVLAAKETP
jgi:hypothetical protein